MSTSARKHHHGRREAWGPHQAAAPGELPPRVPIFSRLSGSSMVSPGACCYDSALKRTQTGRNSTFTFFLHLSQASCAASRACGAARAPSMLLAWKPITDVLPTCLEHTQGQGSLLSVWRWHGCIWGKEGIAFIIALSSRTCLTACDSIFLRTEIWMLSSGLSCFTFLK